MPVIMSPTCVEADVASILLLTDGLANVGISNTEGIVAAMKDPFAHQVGTGRSQLVPKPQ